MNAYGFGSGDPISFTDPFGLCSKADGYKDCCHMSSSPDDAAMFYMSLLFELGDAIAGGHDADAGEAGAILVKRLTRRLEAPRKSRRRKRKVVSASIGRRTARSQRPD
jgi:hypothetical protein